MMAEKARRLKDHHAVELIMSPDPSTHKGIRFGRGVRNFDSAVWDREKQNAVLAGQFYAESRHENHLLRTGNKLWLKPALWIQCGALVSGRIIPGPTTLASGEGNNCSVRHFLPFAKPFAKVRPGRHTPPLADSALQPGMLGFTRVRRRRSRACYPRPALAKVLLRSFRPISRKCRPTKARASGVGPGLALSELSPCLVGSTVTLDDVSLTTKTAIHCGGNAIAPYRYVALLDTGSPQTFIRRDVLDRMLLVGAAPAACVRPCSPRSWGGFGESTTRLRTSTSIRLSVQFSRNNKPTCSLAVRACVVLHSVIQHAVLLCRDGWMRFSTRSYRALSPRPHVNLVFGELTLSHRATTGVSAYVTDSTATDGGFHLLHDCAIGVTLSDELQLLGVNLGRSNGSPALTGQYLVGMLPQPGLLSVQEHFAASWRQVLPSTGVADL